MKIQIDPEFQKIIPPISTEEAAQLEANLVAEGKAHDPLVLWGKTLLDGHHRYEICTRLKLPYTTTQIELPDADAAKLWIIDNQFGRRNLQPFQRIELATLRLDVAKQREQGQKNQKKGTLVSNETKVDVIKTIANISGSSRATVARALPLLNASEAVKQKLRKGDVSIASANHEHMKEKRAADRSAALKVARKSQDDTWGDIRICSAEDLLTSQKGLLDAIITDPPYVKDSVALYGKLAKAAKSALKPNGVLAVFAGQMYLPEILTDMSSYLEYRWMLCYLQPGGQPSQVFARKINQFWKPVLLFGPVQPPTIGDVIWNKPNDRDKEFHHWGQNEAGVADIVERLTKPGQLVCDPFLGGGTTAVVCKHLARKFIGCDIDHKAIETTQDRLSTIRLSEEKQ